MPQTLRNCFRSFSRVVQAMKSLLPTAKPPLPLQENLDRAQPAESAWDHHDYADDHETRCLYSHAEPRDGLWRCCNCLHENEVTHFRGPHPFKIVECPCAHTLCTTCCTTEILTPVRSMATEVFERRSRTVFNGEVLYCRVCPCGLTHRAVRNGNSLDCQDEPCDCGEPVDAGNYYFIGSVHEYRRDPLRNLLQGRWLDLVCQAQRLLHNGRFLFKHLRHQLQCQRARGPPQRRSMSLASVRQRRPLSRRHFGRKPSQRRILQAQYRWGVVTPFAGQPATTSDAYAYRCRGKQERRSPNFQVRLFPSTQCVAYYRIGALLRLLRSADNRSYLLPFTSLADQRDRSYMLVTHIKVPIY
jgi:hypothetical protein